MSNNFPIIVYGANGYTGKLISEYLAKQKLPFIAAGRSQEKLEAALAELPAGTQVQIKAVEHNEAALTELFQGASIVVNVVGPFGQLGEPVVKAALTAGCHYIDTTGEGDYAINMRDRYSDAYKAKDLVFISACSYMWTAGMIAAELALEDPEIHTLDILYAPRSQPSAYLQTGAMVAEACRTILTGGLLATGFQSATKAIGLRQLVGALVKEGLHCEIDGMTIAEKNAAVV